MSLEQKKTCVFANRVKGKDCSALKDNYCVGEKCKFWKSSEEYYLTSERYPVRKERR